jgi:uncharacterized protein YjdB
MGLTDSVVVTVRTRVLSSLQVTPSNISIRVGQTQQFTATALFSDGTTQNVTAMTLWSSSDPAIADIATGGR